MPKNSLRAAIEALPVNSSRAALAGIVAIPAAEAPGRARSLSEAFKAAAQAADPSIKSWWRVVPEDDRDVAFWIVAQRA